MGAHGGTWGHRACKQNRVAGSVRLQGRHMSQGHVIGTCHRVMGPLSHEVGIRAGGPWVALGCWAGLRALANGTQGRAGAVAQSATHTCKLSSTAGAGPLQLPACINGWAATTTHPPPVPALYLPPTGMGPQQCRR